MKSKKLNILVIFFIVFISMFVSKKVCAANLDIAGKNPPDYADCEYISPISNINEKKIPTSIQLTVIYQHYDYEWGSDVSERKFTSSNVTQICLGQKLNSSGSTVYYVGFVLNEPYVFSNDNGTDINQQVFFTDLSIPLSKLDGEYVELKYENKKVNVTKSSEENYKNKLKKQSLNYSNYKETEISKTIYLKFPKTPDKITGPTAGNMNGIAFLKASGSNIYDYISKSDGIVFYKKNSEKYKTARLNAFKDAIKTAKDSSGKVLNSESQQECIDGLSRIMDVSNTDMINYKKSYYDSSKELWLSFIQNELANPKSADVKSYKNTWFGQWFDKSIARYLFEDDLSTFLSVYKYLYGVCDGSGSNQCNIDMNNDGVVGTANDVKVYKNTVTIMESMLHLDKTTKCSLDLSNDPCISVCAKSGECPNYTALDQCKKGEDYITCTNCTPECNKKCEGVGDETSKQQCKRVCYDECTDGRYSEAKDKYDETIQKDKDQIADSAKQIYDLVRVSAPSLDIDFDKHYELTCDDVSFFHWFYVVLRILAPVAVIFFGTLDYAKAVIASDVEKMNKSKKNFPKRLILLILFITVPLIISLLLSIFGGDYSLMDCIINGE